MKRNIHPQTTLTRFQCSCGNEFETLSTASAGVQTLDVCNRCHPFYTGQNKIVTTGQVEKFNRRFSGFAALQQTDQAAAAGSEGASAG